MSKRDMIVLSASAISCLKACPFRYRNAYHLGVRKVEVAEALRIGTNWHEGQDVMSMKPEQPCPQCSELQKPDGKCYLCMGTGYIDDPTCAMIRMLNHRYEHLYPGMPHELKMIERSIILHSLLGYQMIWEDDGIEVVAREIPFRIPLVDPRTRKAIPGICIDGKIDKIVKFDGKYCIMEHKSTGNSVDPSSDYWGRLRLDTQTMLYVYAAQRLQADGLLSPFKIKGNTPICDIIYDVWHKPQIRPKKLSAADTAAFVESGEYFGQEFEATGEGDQATGKLVMRVDGQDAEIEHLKKGFALRETPDMFGARLLSDMIERSEYYFARKPITRTHKDMGAFEWELYNLARTIENYKDSDSWFHNENSCDNYGRCDYMPFCYTGKEVDVDNLPPDFRCIFEKGKE